MKHKHGRPICAEMHAKNKPAYKTLNHRHGRPLIRKESRTMTNKNNEYGTPVTDKALPVWKQRQLLEDAQLKYRERIFVEGGLFGRKKSKPKRSIIKWLLILLIIAIIVLVVVI